MEHYLNKISQTFNLKECAACKIGYPKLKPQRIISLKEKDTLKKVGFAVSEKFYRKLQIICMSSSKEDIEITIGKNVYIMSTSQRFFIRSSN